MRRLAIKSRTIAKKFKPHLKVPLLFGPVAMIQETLQLYVPEEHQNAVGNKKIARYKFTGVLEDHATQEVQRLLQTAGLQLGSLARWFPFPGWAKGGRPCSEQYSYGINIEKECFVFCFFNLVRCEPNSCCSYDISIYRSNKEYRSAWFIPFLR